MSNGNGVGPTKDSNLIGGVDRSIIERFINTFRDNYVKVDKAVFFLELNTSFSGLNMGITNQRDALSHFVSVLSDPGMSQEDMIAQHRHAEEHLRRGITEPYEIACTVAVEKALASYKVYKETTVPLFRKRIARLVGAPSSEDLDREFALIRQYREEAREMKRQNHWDQEWEKGVKKNIAAFEKAEQIQARMEHYINIAADYLAERKSKHLTVLSIVLASVVGVLGIVVAILLANT